MNVRRWTGGQRDTRRTTGRALLPAGPGVAGAPSGAPATGLPQRAAGLGPPRRGLEVDYCTAHLADAQPAHQRSRRAVDFSLSQRSSAVRWRNVDEGASSEITPALLSLLMS